MNKKDTKKTNTGMKNKNRKNGDYGRGKGERGSRGGNKTNLVAGYVKVLC